MWSKVPRSRRPEKTSQISCGYQRLCLRILRESVWIKEGDGLAHQRRAFRGKELPVQGMRKTVWSTHNFESSHAESYRRASISGLLPLFNKSILMQFLCSVIIAMLDSRRNETCKTTYPSRIPTAICSKRKKALQKRMKVP